MEIKVKENKETKIKVAIIEEIYCYLNNRLLSEEIFPMENELSQKELEDFVKYIAEFNRWSKHRAEEGFTLNYIVKRIVTINQ